MEKPTLNGLDLDALEREGEVRDPYTFVLGGETLIAKDPETVDWTVIAALDPDDPREVLNAYLAPDEYRTLVESGLPKWKIVRLVSDLNRHYYGSDEAPGKSQGSPAS